MSQNSISGKAYKKSDMFVCVCVWADLTAYIKHLFYFNKTLTNMGDIREKEGRTTYRKVK
jgi:hypothetical protein